MRRRSQTTLAVLLGTAAMAVLLLIMGCAAASLTCTAANQVANLGVYSAK
jgi:hypothetical protein